MLTAAPPTLAEVAWPAEHKGLPSDTGYALFGALCRLGLVFHGQPDTIVLPLGRELVIRAPLERAWRLAGSGLRGLEVGGRRVWLGSPMVREMAPSPSLRARLVVIKGFTEAGSFKPAAQRQLDAMTVECRPIIGERGVIRVSGKTIVGFGVRLDGLSPADSLLIQSRGLGGKLRMGCGGFVPC